MRKLQNGQALVEFALVSILLFTFILGAIDLSWAFTTRTQDYQAARAAARYAATCGSASTCWSKTSAAGSIQGALKANLTTINVPNQDISGGAGIKIEYFDISGGSSVSCAHYTTAGAGSLVLAGGYTLGVNCVVPGNMITVTANYNYGFITPLLKSSFTGPLISAVGSAMEEQ